MAVDVTVVVSGVIVAEVVAVDVCDEVAELVAVVVGVVVSHNSASAAMPLAKCACSPTSSTRATDNGSVAIVSSMAVFTVCPIPCAHTVTEGIRYIG